MKDGLRDNLENPLRHWDGNEFIPEAAYRSARKCYKNTKKMLTEAMSRAANRKEIEEIVRRYTGHFNKLNDRYEEFIETEERRYLFGHAEALRRVYPARRILAGRCECGACDAFGDLECHG